MQNIRSAPARPDWDAHGVRSYARRGVRLNPRQQRAWDAHADRWVIPVATQYAAGFRIHEVFARPAPLAVEIGLGDGEALASLAAERRDWNILGFEVWQPGVADCLSALEAIDATNVHLSTLDAAWCLENLFEPASVSELWTFFPDPWPKARHHKRRLVTSQLARHVATLLTSGGVWRLATDWSHYAEHMRQVLDAEPLLRGGVTERYAGRPFTRFERRGLAGGRAVTDLAYTRVLDESAVGI